MTFEASNMYIHMAVDNVQIHILSHPHWKDYALQRCQTLTDN